MKKEVILKNYDEYSEIANYAFNNKKYNAAVTLYYKSLVELCDLNLLKKINKVGATHTERFNLLKNFDPELYRISSKLFRFYRDSYSKEISPVVAKLVKENVEKAKRIVFEKKDKELDKEE